MKCVLLVDPARSMLLRLSAAIRSEVRVVTAGTFEEARRWLMSTAPDLLVTNLRLEAYNGLHLVHLAAAADFATRAVVYADRLGAGLAREAQAAGAFCERPDALPYALDAYIAATLPPRDRRRTDRVSRRRSFRGGRRASDVTNGSVGEAPLSVR